MDTNEKLIAKAVGDFFASDLNGSTSGGLLQGTQAREFFQRAIKQNAILPVIRTETIPEGGEHSLPRMAFGDRILHAATEGQALPEAKRAIPTIDAVRIKTYEFIAHVRVTKTTMKRNIEQERFRETLMDAISRSVGRDMEEIVLLGDTASSDPDLAKFDGMLKLAGNSIDLGAAKFGSNAMSTMVVQMDEQFIQDRPQMTFFPSVYSAEYYRQELAGRATGMGDRNQASYVDLAYSGSPVRGAAHMSRTQALLLNPMNAVLGIEERVELEAQYDAPSRMWDFVATVWFGFNYEEADAVVRGYNLAS